MENYFAAKHAKNQHDQTINGKAQIENERGLFVLILYSDHHGNCITNLKNHSDDVKSSRKQDAFKSWQNLS